MKKTKKWLAVLLAGSMIMAGGMSVTASAAEVDEVAPGISQASETVYYNIFDDSFGFVIRNNEAVIVEYDGNSKDVIIPEKVSYRDSNGKIVTLEVTKIDRLGNKAPFSKMDNLRSIFIPSSVKSFGQCVLTNCPNLLRVTYQRDYFNYCSEFLSGCPLVVIHGNGPMAKALAKNRKRPYVDTTGIRLYGDVDFDGQITSGDAQAILRASAEQEYFFSDQKKAADVNCDGSILSDDAMNVLRYSAGYNVTGTKIGQEIE